MGREEGISICIKFVAKKMLKKEMDPAKIAEITGLSFDEIKSSLP